MARFEDREKAKQLRLKGKSYSEIKSILGISKSTLSGWLSEMPLTPEQMEKVRDLNPRRIEHFRQTMFKKRSIRLEVAYKDASRDIGSLSQRDLFVAGLFLYWGEGLKSSRGTVGIANTDTAVINSFIRWLHVLGVKKSILKVRLHLYRDMVEKIEIAFWSKELKIPSDQFRKSYIKDSRLSGLSYKNGFGHGTCNVTFASMPMWEYITMALKRLRELQNRP